MSAVLGVGNRQWTLLSIHDARKSPSGWITCRSDWLEDDFEAIIRLPNDHYGISQRLVRFRFRSVQPPLTDEWAGCLATEEASEHGPGKCNPSQKRGSHLSIIPELRNPVVRTSRTLSPV
jgi:hypothetical protein